MPVRLAVLLSMLLLAASGATSDAAAAGRTAQCRAACADAVETCVATGRRPRACRRQLVRRCRRRGPQVCAVAAPTTSTTVVTATTVTTTTSSTASTATTTSTSSTTSTTVLGPEAGVPWITTGPIQWTTPLAPDLWFGDTMKAVLAVDVGPPWVLVDGWIERCEALDRLACSPQAMLAPTTFAGPPGAFELEGVAAHGCSPPSAMSALFRAVVHLTDAEGTRVGPFYSPLTGTRVHSTSRSAIVVEGSSVEITIREGDAVAPRLVRAEPSCKDGLTIHAVADAAWLTTSWYFGNEILQIDVDTAGFTVAGSPYHATVTLSAPEALGAPVVVPVTVHVTDVDVEWSDVPSSVAAGATFDAALSVAGADVGVVHGLVTGQSWDYWYPFVFPSGQGITQSIAGAAGTFPITVARRASDCDETTATLVADVALTDANGEPAGQVSATSPPIDFPAAPPAIRADDALEIVALAGVDPPAQPLFVGVLCMPPGERGFTVTVDAEWLQVAPYDEHRASPLAVTAHVDGLDPADGPFTATITLTSPAVATPTVVPVTLTVVDAAAEWTVPPPSTIAVGDAFALALTVTGERTIVDGTIRACTTDTVTTSQCDELVPLGLSGDGAFSGAPDTFSFTGERAIASHWVDDVVVEARFFLEGDAPGSRIGPLYAPLVPVAVPQSAQPWLRRVPEAVELTALAGQSPLVVPVWVSAFDGRQYAWTATTDASWLRVEPAGGLARLGAEPFRIFVDASALDPAGGPYEATVTIDAPDTAQGTATIPVRITTY